MKRKPIRSKTKEKKREKKESKYKKERKEKREKFLKIHRKNCGKGMKIRLNFK